MGAHPELAGVAAKFHNTGLGQDAFPRSVTVGQRQREESSTSSLHSLKALVFQDDRDLVAAMDESGYAIGSTL
jgi:hypothetical protein